ncbi:MAG TPA: hypothetical protein VF069_15585 [Streptosporangiaceae bacterium]
MVIPGHLLTERDREALALARTLREHMHGWMSARGVTAPVKVTPYVDPAGRPNVLVRLDSRLAIAMILSLRDLPAQPGPHADPGPASAP